METYNSQQKYLQADIIVVILIIMETYNSIFGMLWKKF